MERIALEYHANGDYEIIHYNRDGSVEHAALFHNSVDALAYYFANAQELANKYIDTMLK